MIDPIANLTSEEREAALDVGQLTLDIIGIFEPTPFADLTSAIISLVRGNWGAAAVSSVAVFPYIGDTAKLVRLSSYVQKLERAIGVARGSPRLAAVLYPLFARLLPVLSRLPVGRLPANVRNAVVRMDRVIRDFLPMHYWAVSRLDQATEAMLKSVLGDTRHVGFLPRQNMRVIVDFLQRNNYADGNTLKWAKNLKGIDLHASDAVVVKQLAAGEQVSMWVDLGQKGGPTIGEWMTRVQSGITHRNLGISGNGRELRIFRLTSPHEVLISRSAPVRDSWTTLRNESILSEKHQRDWTNIELASGGGEQLFLPDAEKVLKPIKEYFPPTVPKKPAL